MPRTIEQATRQLRQFICGLHGHDALLHFDHRHVSLVCVICGHETPGWNLPGAAAQSHPPAPVMARDDTTRSQAA